MRLDLKKKVDVFGQNHSDNRTLGQELAFFLYKGQSDDPVKTFLWAQSLYKGDAIDVDKSDINKLEKIIKDSKEMVDGFKAQVLLELDEVRQKK